MIIVLVLIFSVAALVCALALTKVVADLRMVQMQQRKHIEFTKTNVREMKLATQIELLLLMERVEELEFLRAIDHSFVDSTPNHKPQADYYWPNGDVYVRFSEGDLLFGETFQQGAGDFHLFNLEGMIAQFEYCGKDDQLLDAESSGLQQICEVSGALSGEPKIKRKLPGLVRAEDAGQWRVIKRARIEVC